MWWLPAIGKIEDLCAGIQACLGKKKCLVKKQTASAPRASSAYRKCFAATPQVEQFWNDEGRSERRRLKLRRVVVSSDV